MKTVHLICNAHLDPVWHWECDEGAAAAVSTFRAAAKLCEEFDGFVFNHNEVILYEWIEEYEPKLFENIKRLVSEGKWHIMGGWYLQPDCNMPSGESFVRQILIGRKYFKDKFGARPTTAINFDSFGHSRGLVQILIKSGFDSYIIMRPDQSDSWLKTGNFIWAGFDGSEIICHKIESGYNSLLGKAVQKIKNHIERYRNSSTDLILWGVGNHGGGPSKKDLQEISSLMQNNTEAKIIHSIPEQYFKSIINLRTQMIKVDRDLNPRFTGCYTSQIRIKQKHRMLENEIYAAEKMLTSAAINGLLEYPVNELNQALKDLLFSQFHDVLCGTCVQPVEEFSLKVLDHGLEITSRLKTKAFFALASGQEPATEGQYPILIYNPHPYRVKDIFEFEFMLADQNWEEFFSMPVVYHGNKRLPSQPEKENSNINLDWRKRVVFEAELEPSSMNRFDCIIKVLPSKPVPQVKHSSNYLFFINDSMEVHINCKTGLIDRYIVEGFNYLEYNSFLPIVIKDNDDSWRMDTDRFDIEEGYFELMDKENGSVFSGISRSFIDSVRVIEDGEVRTVVECVMSYGLSRICMVYKLPKRGTFIDVHIKVYWNEKSKMLKLSIPTTLKDANYFGQTAFGTESLSCDGTEVVSQKWSGCVSHNAGRAVVCINDGIYGSSYINGEIRLSLLRSAAYTAHPVEGRPLLVQDRYLPRMDQGERIYNFRLKAGSKEGVLKEIDYEALTYNEKPYVLSFSPSGYGVKPSPVIEVDNKQIIMTAFKKSEYDESYILRLFNSSSMEADANIKLPLLGIHKGIKFSKYEVKTFSVKQNEIKEVNMIEEYFLV